MILQETPWEREHLRVRSSAVFHFEEGDSEQNIPSGVLDNREYEYQEATVPMNKIGLVNALLRSGFSFAEVAISMEMNLDDMSIPAGIKKRMSMFSCHPAGPDELGIIFESIRSGDVYQTDKIALNPRFGAKVAGARYARWSENEITLGRASAYIVQHKDERMGFFIISGPVNRVVDGLLTGLFDKERYKGFGYFNSVFLLETAKSLCADKVLGRVSSNNPAVLKLTQKLGYRIQSMRYVLSKEIAL